MLFADADGASKFSDFLEKLERGMVKIVKKSNNLGVVCSSRAHLEEESIANVSRTSENIRITIGLDKQKISA